MALRLECTQRTSDFDSPVAGERSTLAAMRTVAMHGANTASDTSPAVRARMDQHYREMSPLDKLARVIALTEASHELALATIRRLHPTESNREHRLRLLSRYLAREQMLAAFGWDTALRGY